MKSCWLLCNEQDDCTNVLTLNLLQNLDIQCQLSVWVLLKGKQGCVCVHLSTCVCVYQRLLISWLGGLCRPSYKLFQHYKVNYISSLSFYFGLHVHTQLHVFSSHFTLSHTCRKSHAVNHSSVRLTLSLILVLR